MTGDSWMSDHRDWAELARQEIAVGIEPLNCPECGLPLPGPHRGTCSVSLAHGGSGYGLPLVWQARLHLAVSEGTE